MPITRDQVQYRLLEGARIVRFERGVRTAYKAGSLIWLTASEREKYKFITEPIGAAAVQKHEVRIAVPPEKSSAKPNKK